MIKDNVGYILMAIILVIVTITAIITATYELRDKQINGFFKSLTSMGWFTLVLYLVTIVLTVAQHIYTERITEITTQKRDSTLRADYAQSVDSLTKNFKTNTTEMKVAYDTSTIGLKNRYDTSTTNIVKALAVYGLKYDAAKDSIESLVRNTTIPTPVLQLDPGKELIIVDSTESEYVFQANHRSSDASSTNYNVLSHYVYVFRSNQIIYGGNFNTFPQDLKLGKDQVWHTKFSAPKDLNFIFVLLKGNYTNSDGSKTYPINTLYRYDFDKRKPTIILGSLDRDIKAFISSSNQNIKLRENAD